MPNDPVTLHEVLRQEYQTLRPGFDFSGENTSEVLNKLRRQEETSQHPLHLCGRIRSAILALGALQALADYRIFDELTTYRRSLAVHTEGQ